MDLATIITIVGGLFGAGGIAAILKSTADNKKTSAEAEVTLGTGWQVLYQTSRQEINELRERLALVERSDQDCKRRLAKLEAEAGGVDVEKTVLALIQKEIDKRGEKIDR